MRRISLLATVLVVLGASVGAGARAAASATPAPVTTATTVTTVTTTVTTVATATSGTSSTGTVNPAVAQPRASPNAPLRYRNPLRDGDTGKPLSCPDPSVIRAHRGKWNFFVFCTSDNARNAFPIYMSTNLVRWYPDGFVFPHGHEPSWAMPSDGHTRRGIYWAPSIYRFDDRWVLYFAAAYNPASHRASATIKAERMVIGVATSDRLAGPWHSNLLYYNGKFNLRNSKADREGGGGDIDPGVVTDPRTGKRYLFWAEQRERIWEAPLSANGLELGPQAEPALGVSEPWECSALCTIEGPQPIWHDGQFYILFSAASTWNASYVVGVASAPNALDPLDPFVTQPKPILRAGNGFLGPGGESDPVRALDGREMIMYHALTHIPSSHDSGARLLMLGTFNWRGGEPIIDGGIAR